MADEKNPAAAEPTLEQAAAVSAAGVGAAMGEQTPEAAQQAAESAVRREATQRNVALSDEDVSRIAEETVKRLTDAGFYQSVSRQVIDDLEERGAMEPPPAPTPPPPAPAAEAQGAPPPAPEPKRSFAEWFQRR